jgi:NAD(P)-dependent dehydrogenase (short-subunit alcohol dehydrogenase family)
MFYKYLILLLLFNFNFQYAYILSMNTRIVLNKRIEYNQKLSSTMKKNNKLYTQSLFQNDYDINNSKMAIITGGTRGIGFGIATSLAESNYDLILTYNANKKRAEQSKRILENEYGIFVKLVGGDISLKSTRDLIFNIYDKNYKNTHELEVIIHNAGQYIGITSDNNIVKKNKKIIKFGDSSILSNTGEVNMDEIKYYQALYGDAYIDICERGLVRMSKKGGSLIGVSSSGCSNFYNPVSGYDLPGTGKCIMEYAMRYIALRCAKNNINCNIIIPEPIKTDALNKMKKYILQLKNETTSSEYDNMMSEYYPMGYSSPKQIGDIVRFLCSQEGRIINGVSLPIDGGGHLKL